jgi:tetratricopeptide (TPR) repeat protein
LSIDPNNIRALINKGRSLSQLHRFEEAISNYDRALKVDRQNTDAFINKGLSLYNLGKNAEAITYFDKVLAAEPNNLWHRALSIGQS